MDYEKIKIFLKKNYLQIILVLLLIYISINTVRRIIHLYLFSELDPKDLYDFTTGGQFLLNGINPYTREDLWTRHHPPGIFFLYAILMSIFGNTPESMRAPTYLFVILTAFMIYICTRKIIIKNNPSKHFKNQKNSSEYEIYKNNHKNLFKVNISKEYQWMLPWVATLLYLNDRAVQDRFAEGSYEAFTTFFFFMGFYFFLNNKDILAAFFWGISLIIQLVAFFMWPFLLIYYFSIKDWKRFSIYFWIIFLIILFSFLPFIIDDYQAVIESFSLLTLRETTNYSYFWFFPEPNLFKEKLYSKVGYFSLWFIIQVISYALIIAILLYKKKRTRHNLMISTFIIYLSLPILTNSYGIRYLNWLAPIFYIVMLLKKKPLKIFLFYFMSYYCIELFWNSFSENPWLMVSGSYFFSISLILLLFKDLERNTRSKVKIG